MYTQGKKILGYFLLVSVAVLTLLGVLSIWDWVGNDVFWRAGTTLLVLLFSGLVALGVMKMTE